MKPLFIGAVGVITKNLAEGRALYVDAIGLPLKQAEGTRFLHSEQLEGSKYFGVWPLSEAARVCFGTEHWPTELPVPQLFIEFEVSSPASVVAAASDLKAKGIAFLHGPRTDPWGQTVARLQTKDGLVIGISYVPWMHRSTKRRTQRAKGSRRRHRK